MIVGGIEDYWGQGKAILVKETGECIPIDDIPDPDFLDDTQVTEIERILGCQSGWHVMNLNEKYGFVFCRKSNVTNLLLERCVEHYTGEKVSDIGTGIIYNRRCPWTLEQIDSFMSNARLITANLVAEKYSPF